MPMMDILKGKVVRQDWIFVGVVLVVTVLLFVGFFFGVYTRQQTAIEARKEHYTSMTRELERARAIDRDIDDLRERAAEMTYLVEVFEKRLPDEREIPALLGHFERLGGELGLRVQLVSLPTKTSPRMEVIPYRVTAHGQFHQIVNFVNMFERDERYLKVSDINIGPERDGVSQAEFVLSTFRFIQREPGATE